MDVEQNKLQLLIVSIGNSRYGIDIDQIAYLMNINAAESTVSFEQLMSVGSFVECNYSKMLIIKGEIRIPILISEPDEVVTVSVGDIRRLPDILMVASEKKGVWGVLPQAHGIIILIDFYKNQRFNDLGVASIKYYET